MTEESPLPSCISSEGGGEVGGKPLRLAFRAREGVEVVDGRETPPSCNLSKEGVVYRQRNHPLRLAFRARKGVKVVDGREVVFESPVCSSLLALRALDRD